MPVTVVVGGQYGSEGKGKVAHWLAKEMQATAAIRTGGPNSGHTVISANGQSIIFKHLPTAAILPEVVCCIGAGSYILPKLLLEEVALANLSEDRLFIDPNAVVITPQEVEDEQYGTLRETIGSTSSGTGAAVRKRIERKRGLQFAGDHQVLRRFARPVIPFLRQELEANNRVILEGTQGFGLSLYHSAHYPFVTSRDTTAAAFMSEAGLSPLDSDDVVLVIRAHPIRVGGNSGPLPNETTWHAISRACGSQKDFSEVTSVTRTLRRVAHFSPDVVLEAIRVNRPSRLVLNHIDYIDASCSISNSLSESAERFVVSIEQQLFRTISLVGTSPKALVSRSG